MPATFTELLPATKSSKHSTLNWTPAPTRDAGKLTIDTDRTRTLYTIRQFPTEFPGLAFHFEKTTSGTDREESGYNVFVCARTGGQNPFCDCKGFTRFSHCKHLDAAIALIDNGWLSPELSNTESDVENTELPF
jgi:hypothetical protein